MDRGIKDIGFVDLVLVFLLYYSEDLVLFFLGIFLGGRGRVYILLYLVYVLDLFVFWKGVGYVNFKGKFNIFMWFYTV